MCNLVYIQDLTLFYRDIEQEKKNEKLLVANASILEELAVPQKTVLVLSKQLIETCQESQSETLQAIRFATSLMQLPVANLTSLEHLKFGRVVTQEKNFDVKEAIMEIIAIFVVQAKLKSV